MKAWKHKCEVEFRKIKQDRDQPCFDQIYQFFCSIESIAYDFCKAIMIDCECLAFKPSILMASVISITIELYLKIDVFNISNLPYASSVILNELLICNMVWEKLIEYLFGGNSLPHLDRFGHYIVQRAQLIYNKVKPNKDTYMNFIYKNRCLKYYEHKHL
jgi:hypothetical protein